jgi:hypothetical protein
LTNGSHDISFYIHSKAKEDAMSSLDLLVGLQADQFDTMEFRYLDPNNATAKCPLTIPILQKLILQNSERENKFSFMIFTSDQSRTLATSGTKTKMSWFACKFEDDGASFLEALAARADSQTGLAKTLTIMTCLPFAEGILVLFLRQCKLECLVLQEILLESEDACQAMVVAELHILILDGCVLADGGAALVESLREGRGPKGLVLFKSIYDEDCAPFDSSER